MLSRSWTLPVVALVLLAMHASSAQAQALRTWVSGTGDDMSPCSRTAPCKTYANAISKTAAGGEISALDSGGYGGITITKSISLMAIGAEASILGFPFVINAGANDIVHLDGLSFSGVGNGTVGLRIVSAGVVDIRRCVITDYRGSPGLGIEIVPTANTKVFISDCAISGNSDGIMVRPNGGMADVFIDRLRIAHNAGTGLTADGKTATIRLNSSVIAGNATGLAVANGGSILSFGNNSISGNGNDGVPTGALKPE